MATKKNYLAKYREYKELSIYQLGYLKIKRINDFLLAILGIIVLSFPMAIIAVVSKVNEPTEKVVFSQKRVGKNGKIFNLYKFRTLSNVPEYMPAAELNIENHVTRWGEFLRKSSLDELLQIINIIKGDMSFIGPRPLIPQEHDIHERRKELGVYQVCPGLTGLAQIKGRNKLTPHKKAVYDAFYLHHLSLIFDIKIFFVSIWKVLKEENV